MADATKTSKPADADEPETEAPAIVAGPEPRELSAAEKAHDKASAKAREAELARQQDVVAAVAKAHADELPALGGPLLEPGLGR